MSVPSIQIAFNDTEVQIFWEIDTSGTYVKYDILYVDNVIPANTGVIADSIPNAADNYYSKNTIFFKFKRGTFSLATSSSFNLRLRAYDSIGATFLGDEKYVPSMNELMDQYKTTQIYGYDYDTNIWRKVRVNSDGVLS
jgi:hypothetical protein